MKKHNRNRGFGVVEDGFVQELKSNIRTSNNPTSVAMPEFLKAKPDERTDYIMKYLKAQEEPVTTPDIADRWIRYKGGCLDPITGISSLVRKRVIKLTGKCLRKMADRGHVINLGVLVTSNHNEISWKSPLR